MRKRYEYNFSTFHFAARREDDLVSDRIAETTVLLPQEFVTGFFSNTFESRTAGHRDELFVVRGRRVRILEVRRWHYTLQFVRNSSPPI